MPINPNIPLQAANIPQIRYQPESQFESFAKIQPTLNAMQQMKQRAVAVRGAAQIEEYMRSRGHNINLGELGALMIRAGKVEEGAKLIAADNERKQMQEALGGMGLGQQAAEPTGVNAMAAAPSANAMAQPSVPSPAITAPAVPVTAPATPTAAPSMAPQGQPAGFRPTPQQLAQLAASGQAGGRVASALAQFAKPETTPSEIAIAKKFGFELTPEGYSAMKGAGRAETQGPEIVQLMRARDALPAGSPDRALVQARIDRLNAPPAPAATVNLNQRLEGREQAAKGELNVAQYKDIVTAASVARRTLPALETQQRVLDEGFRTGFGTEAQKVGASVLSALGVPEAEKFASNAQVFISAMNQAVLQRQLEQKGPQTEADAQRITATGAQLGNTVEANKFIIAVAKAQLKRDLQQRQFWDAYWNKNQTYEGVEQAWEAGAGGKSLFDMPELSAYAKPAPRPQSGRGAAGGQRPASGVDRSNPLLQ